MLATDRKIPPRDDQTIAGIASAAQASRNSDHIGGQISLASYLGSGIQKNSKISGGRHASAYPAARQSANTGQSRTKRPARKRGKRPSHCRVSTSPDRMKNIETAILAAWPSIALPNAIAV